MDVSLVSNESEFVSVRPSVLIKEAVVFNLCNSFLASGFSPCAVLLRDSRHPVAQFRGDVSCVLSNIFMTCR